MRDRNFEISDIKLVIWDLDDTFWKGILSEGEINPISQNLDLVKALSDIGIMNSINSKNDSLSVEKKLTELGVWDYFVFPSVNWDPKGQRIKNQITMMNLRPANVLFIDDNHYNLEEAIYYCPEIMTAFPSDLNDFYHAIQMEEKKDPDHIRLSQYKLMEAKNTARVQASSDEAFLYQCDIQVEIHLDCLPQIERIHDLIIRSNQLNYTKERLTKETLTELLKDTTIHSGFITARDKFGDYGIIGFFACKNKKLLHFAFSCRILGMGVEQYVYAVLNYPDIEVKGEVISQLVKSGKPDWINNFSKSELQQVVKMSVLPDAKALLKGPCDMQQLFSYIEENELIDSEFTYVNAKTGVSIEQHNHTVQIVESVTLTENQKKCIIGELPFSDENMFSDKIFTESYRIVFLSMLTDANLGVYRRKETGEFIAFGECYYALTDRNNWNGYINGEIFSANCKFTLDFLEFFSDHYEFIGRLPIDQMINNLHMIRNTLHPETILVLILGSETPYLKNHNPSYANRHIVHHEINHAVKKWTANTNNVRILDFNEYIKGQGSYFNNINHFIKPVYYQMAKDIMVIVNDYSGSKINHLPKYKLLYDYAKQITKKLLGRV